MQKKKKKKLGQFFILFCLKFDSILQTKRNENSKKLRTVDNKSKKYAIRNQNRTIPENR